MGAGHTLVGLLGGEEGLWGAGTDSPQGSSSSPWVPPLCFPQLLGNTFHPVPGMTPHLLCLPPLLFT